MIITIFPSSAIFHAIAYNEIKVEKGLATLLEAQNIDGLRPEAYTTDKLQRYFLNYSARNTYIKKAQFMSLSVARARNTLIGNSST